MWLRRKRELTNVEASGVDRKLSSVFSWIAIGRYENEVGNADLREVSSEGIHPIVTFKYRIDDSDMS